MNFFSGPPNKAHFLAAWMVYGALFGLALLATSVFKLSVTAVCPTLVMIGTLIYVFQNRPSFCREGHTIVFRDPARKTTKTKPADMQVSRVIEWTGYEGTLYDIVWEDGDTWTISGRHWVSLKDITSELQKCGFTEVPMQKDLMVFRPQSSPEFSGWKFGLR